MLIFHNKNTIDYQKIRSPSAINGNVFKKNILKKNVSTPRITSAMNIPLVKNKSDFYYRNINKPNSTTYRKLNNNITVDTTFNSKGFIFSPVIGSSSSNHDLNNRNSKIMLKKNKNIFGKFFFRGKEKFEEENKKIESVLSELMIWDNKQLIENNESFKAARIFCEKEKERLKIQKKYTERNQQFNEKKKSGWFFSDDNNKNILQLKYSVFDKDYDMNKIKDEEDKKREKILSEMKDDLKNNLKKVTQNTAQESEKEKTKFENLNRDQLMKIYKYIIINKTKKRKYKEIIESTYNLLNQARNECKLSVDLLQERIKSVQKYYEAYIESVNKMNEIEYKKFNNMEIYEEKVHKYREYLAIYEEINKEIKIYENKYNVIKEDLESFINEIKTKIEVLNDEINKFKYLFNELKEAQIEYYLEKLKKGVDTRNEGLSWIVKKLMELKYKIEPILFPGFLDQEQIKYIIQISKLGFECNQIKHILKSLRDKNSEVKKNSEGKNKNIILNKKRKTLIFKEIKDNGLAEDINFEVDFNDCFKELIEEKGEINKKITDLQEKFTKREGISPIIKYKIENKKLNMITQKIKNKMNIYANTKDNKLFENEHKNRDNLMRYLIGEEKEKEYFKDIFVLRERTKRLDEIITKLKKEEYLIFEEKMKLYETKEKYIKRFYDKIFNALFGNTSFEISSKLI